MRLVSLVSPLALTLLVTGCDRPREAPEGAAPGRLPETAETKATATEAEAEVASEDFGEWDTEAFSSAAGRQLEPLKNFLKGKAADDSWEAATCDGLTGFPLTSLPTSSAFVVQRADVLNGEQTTLLDGLNHLRKRFEGESVRLAEIKIVHVDLTENAATTELYVHLADQHLQINAIWNAEWIHPAQPVLRAIKTHHYEECRRPGPGSLVDSTGSVIGDGVPEVEQFARGMDHWVARIETLSGIEVGGWHGVAVADVNGDGLDDVYMPDGGGLTNRLLIQRADGSVRDASRESGLGFLDHSFSALFADFDNDGDQDLALAMVAGVLILENHGDGTFKVSGAKLLPAAAPYSLCAADYDQDGNLDLYVCCYVPRAGATRHSFVARPVPYHDAENGGRNELFRNEGNLRFRNVTKAVGLDAGNRKFSYSATWDDYDGDGDLDLYVANDFGANHLYRNRLQEKGQAVFEEVAEAAGVRDVAAGMSACWGDYNNDGLVDLYVGNMFSSAGNRIAFQDRFKPGRDAETLALYRRHARGNSLFRNRGDGTFQDESVPSGTTMGRWAWSSLFADLDNDGWEDLLVANGFITQADPEDL